MPEGPGTTVVWRKSSRSGGGANECVEIAFDPSCVRIRDSKNPGDAGLLLDRQSWSTFLDAVKAGRFDRG